MIKLLTILLLFLLSCGPWMVEKWAEHELEGKKVGVEIDCAEKNIDIVFTRYKTRGAVYLDYEIYGDFKLPEDDQEREVKVIFSCGMTCTEKEGAFKCVPTSKE